MTIHTAMHDNVAQFCHDGRNLLQGLRIAAELLETAPDCDRPHLLSRIIGGTDCLCEYLDVTLERYKAAHDPDYSPPARPFSPASRTHLLVNNFAHHCANLSLSMTIDVGQCVPETVLGIPVLFTQVLTNFLSNALKYSPPGGCINVCIRSEGPMLRVAVSDQGPGISPDFLPRLFGKFSQAPDAKAGSGIGLHLCKRMVDSAGGQIGVEQTEGQGSTFFCKLPIELPETGAAVDCRAPEESISVAVSGHLVASASLPTSVLIVDDEPAVSEVAALALKRLGLVCESAHSVRAALDMVASSAYDLILVDEGLEDGSGLDLVHQIRATGNSVPIIGTSGYDYSGDFLAAGASAFLLKPYGTKQLRSAVTEMLSTGGVSVESAGSMN